LLYAAAEVALAGFKGVAEEYWHSEQCMPRWVKGLIASRCSDAARRSPSHNISLVAGLIKVMSDK